MMCAWNCKDIPNPCQSNKKGKDTLGYQNFVQNSSGFFDLEDLQHDSMTSRFLKQPWPTKIIWCWNFKTCFPFAIADCSWQQGLTHFHIVNQNSAWTNNRWQDSKFVLMKIMNSQPQNTTKHHKSTTHQWCTKPTKPQPPWHDTLPGDRVTPQSTRGILERLRGAPRPCEGGWLVRLEDASLKGAAGGGLVGGFGWGGKFGGEGCWMFVCFLGVGGCFFLFFLGEVVGDGLFFIFFGGVVGDGLFFFLRDWSLRWWFGTCSFFGWLNGWKGMRVHESHRLNNRWIASWREVELTLASVLSVVKIPTVLPYHSWYVHAL